MPLHGQSVGARSCRKDVARGEPIPVGKSTTAWEDCAVRLRRSKSGWGLKSWEFWASVVIFTTALELAKWHWYVGIPAAVVLYGLVSFLTVNPVATQGPSRQSDPDDAARLAALSALGKDRRAGLVSDAEFEDKMARILRSEA